MKKNYELELWRFVAAIMVILYHSHKQLFGDPSFKGFSFSFFCHGYVAVEFFFIVSGIMLGKKLYMLRDEKFPLIKETGNFIKRRYSSVFSYALIGTGLNMLFIILTSEERTLTSCIRFVLDSLSTIFMLQCIGIPTNNANPFLWYITVMLLVSLIIYVLGRIRYTTFVKTGWIISIIILTYLYFTTGMLSGVHVKIFGIEKCIWRGFAEMIIGASLYEPLKTFKEKQVTRTERLIYTALEILAYGYFLIYSTVDCTRKLEYLALLLVAVAIIITLSEHSFLSALLNRKSFGLLGKLSLPMYVTQGVCIKVAEKYVGASNLYLYYFIVLVMDIALSFVAIHLLDRKQAR